MKKCSRVPFFFTGNPKDDYSLVKENTFRSATEYVTPRLTICDEDTRCEKQIRMFV